MYAHLTNFSREIPVRLIVFRIRLLIQIKTFPTPSKVFPCKYDLFIYSSL